MSENKQQLNSSQLQTFQDLLLWLRLAGVLFFAAAFWQAVIAAGLVFSLNWTGLFQLAAAVAFGVLGNFLWRASKLMEKVQVEIKSEDLQEILMEFSRYMLLFFKWAVLSLLILTVASLLLALVGFLLIITSSDLVLPQ